MENWQQNNDSLEKTFVLDSFEDVMRFMVLATPHISEKNHHPTWTNTYNQLHVKLTTHNAGNQVTEKDRELARFLDTLYETFAAELLAR
ncbi:MAG: 4a-hydroxytetrahydrobiopterin dehydratase [Aquirufa sp.]